MKIYKADLKTDVYYIIGFVVLFAAVIPLSSRFDNSKYSWLFLSAFLLLFLLVNFLISRLNEIHLDILNNNLTFIYKNYFSSKKVKNYDLSKVEFTYKLQAISRGAIANVCSIYYLDKKIIQIIPDRDDWDDSEIRYFVYDLIEAGVKENLLGIR